MSRNISRTRHFTSVELLAKPDKARRSRETTKATARVVNTAFTLIELLVVVAVISILMSLLLPALRSARAVAQSITCTNNLRQLDFATQMYVNDTGFYPKGWEYDRWWNKTSPIPTYLGYDKLSNEDYYHWNSNTVLNCPSSPYEHESLYKFYCDYGANKGIFRTSSAPYVRNPREVPTPSQKVLMMDFKKLGSGSDGDYWALCTGWEYRETNSNHTKIWTDRHRGQFNIVWADSHISHRKMGDLEDKKNFRTGDMSD